MPDYTLREKAGILGGYLLHRISGGRILIRRRRPRALRGYDAAKVSRLTNDWTRSSKSLDEDLKGDLSVVRARSRDLCMNNDYGRKFMWLLAGNVVGPAGIRLQSKVKNVTTRGKESLDQPANIKIERAWKKWGRKENCTVDRRLSMVDVQRLIAQTVPRDGEILIRKVTGFDNPFGFALQVIDPDYLDHTYTDDRARIRMGVERNEWKEPVAYHLSVDHPGENTITQTIGKYKRIPAREIIHQYMIERAEQTRGAPWTVTALRRLHMLGHYEDNELVASRVGAAKMGFFYRDESMSYPYDDKDASGNLIDEVAPGQFKELPPGYRFEKFDTDHPNTGFDTFCKAILKGASSGLNVSYVSLASDLKETSYGSARQGLLEDRDYWRTLQGWMIEHFMQPIFDAWLPLAIASGEIDLPLSDIERWNAPMWQGRRWTWIDPQKDMTANEKAVGIGINSRTRIAAEQGADIDDIFDDLAREKDKAEALGIDVEPKNTTPPKDGEDGEEDQNRESISRLRVHAG